MISEIEKQTVGSDVNRYLCEMDCPFLKPREEEQTKEKEPHRCLKYGEVLFHGYFHPRIRRCGKCFEATAIPPQKESK